MVFLKNYTERKFSPEISSQVLESLHRNYCVSTAEHHGPMGHPFFFQSAILRGLVNPGEAIVNFCTSNVSLGNSSYPRGFVFYGDGDNAGQEYLHLPLFSAHQRMKPVFGLLAYSHENLESITMPKLRTYLSE